MRRPISHASHKASVDAWNARHPSGTRVLAILEDGTHRETVTTSQAFIFVDHSSAIHLMGIAGAFPLHRVRSL